MAKLTSTDIELAVANFFCYRTNIIVPNIHWGFGLNYECDILIITPHGYAHEIEIKVTKNDIKREQKKRSFVHVSNKIKKFSYAVPENLSSCEYLPNNCGLIVVNNNFRCKTIRPPRINKSARKLTEKEINKILHLGCMRIWNLKQALHQIKYKFIN